VRVHEPASVHREIGYFTAALFKTLAGINYGVMLDGRGNDVITGFGDPEERKIVSLGPAAREHDLGSTTA
jgi:hypothetical protein